MSCHRTARVVALRQRTGEAVDQLRSMRCSDPAADPALDTVRLTAHTLEQWWLPELVRLCATTPIGDR